MNTIQEQLRDVSRECDLLQQQNDKLQQELEETYYDLNEAHQHLCQFEQLLIRAWPAGGFTLWTGNPIGRYRNNGHEAHSVNSKGLYWFRNQEWAIRALYLALEGNDDTKYLQAIKAAENDPLPVS